MSTIHLHWIQFHKYNPVEFVIYFEQSSWNIKLTHVMWHRAATGPPWQSVEESISGRQSWISARPMSASRSVVQPAASRLIGSPIVTSSNSLPRRLGNDSLDIQIIDLHVSFVVFFSSVFRTEPHKVMRGFDLETSGLPSTNVSSYRIVLGS